MIIPIPRAKTGTTGAKISHMTALTLVYFSVLPDTPETILFSLNTHNITRNGENAIIAHNIPTLMSMTSARVMSGMIIKIAAAAFMMNSIMTPTLVVSFIVSETDVILEKSRIDM